MQGGGGTGELASCHSTCPGVPCTCVPTAVLCVGVLQVFPLSEAAAAHKQVETGHTRGKVVLQIP